MIVRISMEGQYRLPGAVLDKLNELDHQVVTAVAAEDEAQFKKLYAQMIDLVRSKGKPLPHEEIRESELILPPADTSLAEAKKLFVGDGVVPG